jgi:hypothetical protein
MDNLDSHMDQFFSAATDALKGENNLLEQYFSNCERDLRLYRKNHHGITILFETTMVYFVFRELLKRQFPYEVGWEKRYPKSQSTADLVLVRKRDEEDEGSVREQDKADEAYIEFKVGKIKNWKKQEAKGIKSDLTKMNTFAKESRRFVFAIWYSKEDGLEDLNWLKEVCKGVCTLQQIKPGHYERFPTMFRSKHGELEEWQVHLALLEAK